MWHASVNLFSCLTYCEQHSNFRCHEIFDARIVFYFGFSIILNYNFTCKHSDPFFIWNINIFNLYFSPKITFQMMEILFFSNFIFFCQHFAFMPLYAYPIYFLNYLHRLMLYYVKLFIYSIGFAHRVNGQYMCTERVKIKMRGDTIHKSISKHWKHKI